MTTSTDVKDVVRERRREAVELEEKAREAERLEQELQSLGRDLERFLDRQRRFAALGDDHLEVVQKSPHAGLGVIEWQPLKSKLNGTELAAAVQPNVDSLKTEIAWRKKRISALLS
jgi:hypothetical protein